jgi:hypothetical protein
MPVELTIEGTVAKVVLNRPDKLNALTLDMRQSLCDYFAQLRFDDNVRAVIVTGAGRGFCSGADVDRMAGQPHDLRADRERMQRGGHTFIRALHSIEKPTIAAVRGKDFTVRFRPRDFLNRCRDSERNREVQELPNAARTSPELNRPCGAKRKREARRCKVRFRGCDSLTAIAALAAIRNLGGLAVWFGVRGSLTAFAGLD